MTGCRSGETGQAAGSGSPSGLWAPGWGPLDALEDCFLTSQRHYDLPTLFLCKTRRIWGAEPLGFGRRILPALALFSLSS